MAFIWKISIVEFKNKSIINGVILNGSPSIRYKKIGSFNNFVNVISSYYRTPYSYGKLHLLSGGEEYKLSTDYRGGFNFEIDHKIDENFEVFIEGQSQPLIFNQTYPVFFKESETPLCIISDVDDTILVSHTANIWKRINTLLFVSPHKRKNINFTQQLLNKVSDKNGRIFYVSKSEANLYAIITSFIKNSNLPIGYLMLTPYLRFMQLFNPKKGKDYKKNMIELIIQNSQDKRFILMGDDTQQDIAVYTNIAELYPDRILKIYIRKTLKNITGNKRNQLNKLLGLTVSTLYFNNETDPKEEIMFIQNHQNK